jgi:hypothetical protein
MKKIIAVSAIVLASLGLSLPAGATSHRTLAQRHLRAVLRADTAQGFDVPTASSVHCVGAMPFYGKNGSTFSCFVYNRKGQGLGNLNGTNLGGNGANLQWLPVL